MGRNTFQYAMVAAILYGALPSGADEVRKIQDNSFLIEEAYNQEAGVVQHIQSFEHMGGRDWAYTFTQEWPLWGQENQFSYMIPYSRIGDAEAQTGFGDILLNYRYQAVLHGPVALAPRASLILPTGDPDRGLGNGAWGVQGNLPLSVELAERWVTHWNLGATFIPGAKGADGSQADITGFNYGASFIYLFNDHFNLMLEVAGNTNQVVAQGGHVEMEDSLFINPGMRFAIDFQSGLQIVPGLSFPIGVGPSEGQVAVFLYLSLEHPFAKSAQRSP